PTPARYLGGPGPTALAASVRSGLTAGSDATDGTVHLFTATSNDRLSRSGVIAAAEPGAMVYALALAPHDRVLPIGDNRAHVSLWDVSDPAAPARKSGPLAAKGPIERLAFAPNSSELAAVGGNEVTRWAFDGTIRGELPAVPSPSLIRT